MTGLLAAWPIIKRFWWIVPLVALAFIVLAQRADIAGKAEELTKASAQVADLTKSNADAKRQLDGFAQQRIDNDAIANAVAGKIGNNVVHETNTRTIIERAASNDPKVRDWLGEPVPSSVRGALSSDRPDANAR